MAAPSISSLLHDSSLVSRSYSRTYPPSPAVSYRSGDRSNSDASICTEDRSNCSCDLHAMRLPSISSLLADCPLRQEHTPDQSPRAHKRQLSVSNYSYSPNAASQSFGPRGQASPPGAMYSPESATSYITATAPPYFSHSRSVIERYPCDCCNKSFSRPSSLRIHKHSHTGERPFVCSVTGCERAFSVRSNMRRHMKVHQAE